MQPTRLGVSLGAPLTLPCEDDHTVSSEGLKSRPQHTVCCGDNYGGEIVGRNCRAASDILLKINPTGQAHGAEENQSGLISRPAASRPPVGYLVQAISSGPGSARADPGLA